jgi:peptide-methionine (S)-S-oxide reductase
MRTAGLVLILVLGAGPAPIPPPSADAPLAKSPAERKVVLAGGCFWGVEAVFEHLKGVTKAVSGYSGGSSFTARYEIVSSGVTSHAESVEVSYDPSRITLGQILRVFFAVAHDPTQKNRQGPDFGAQYRSAIFFADAEQEKIARAYVAQLDQAGVFGRPIATQIVALEAFYAAETYHQEFAARHPDHPYIRIHDAPKVEKLRKAFPELYVGRD